MPRVSACLLTLILLLAACGPTGTPPATPKPDTSIPVASATQAAFPTPSPLPSLPPTITPTPKPLRNATFAEIVDLVEFRLSTFDAFIPATVGVQMQMGDEARTNDTGKARLDLQPDGTILRLVPNSSVVLTELEGDASSPFTRLELLIGRVFIILNGGSLEVTTPSGVAAVRGSMMGVYYDPSTGNLTATCLEGHCSLGNDKGVIELVEGQAADIRDGVLSSVPRVLTDAELMDWLTFVPEVQGFLDRFPRLRQLADRIRDGGIIPPRRWP